MRWQPEVYKYDIVYGTFACITKIYNDNDKSQHSLVEQVGLLSSVRVKDLNTKFRPRALLEQLHAQLLRGGQEEGGGVGHHVLALPSHLKGCFRLFPGPQILANLAVRCFIHLLPGGKESGPFLKTNKIEK